MKHPNQPLHRVQKSIFWKLTLILLVAAFLVLAIVAGFFRAVWVESTEPPWKAHAHQYISYLVSDIGWPPDTVKAKAICSDLDIQLRFETADGLWWQSASVFEEITLKSDPDWIRRFRDITYGDWNHQFLIRVDKPGYRIWIFPADSRVFSPDWGKITLLLLALLLVLAGIFLAIRRVLRPVRMLMDGIRQISDGNLDVRFPEKRTDEFGALTNTLNELTTAVRDRLRARDQLLLDVSHELRSPLTRMKIGLELPDRQEMTDSLAADIREMETLITGILETERMRSPHARLNTGPVNLVAEIADLIRLLAEPNRFNLIAPPQCPTVPGDRERLRLVFRNLLENALKYGNQLVTVSLEELPTGLRVVVADDGDGIPLEDLPYVFEPFYRADKSRTRSTGGFGLGLALCKSVVEAHGGTIHVESANRETRFGVWLPFQPPSAVLH